MMKDGIKTRDEHLTRCKRHALAYLKRHRYASAVTSMLNNLQQHPETSFRDISMFQAVGFMYAEHGDVDGMRRFIEGFR